MKESTCPMTPAIRELKAASVRFTSHCFTYKEHGGAEQAAEELGVPLHAVVKTLVMEAHGHDAKKTPLLILMHGDKEVSTKQMARILGVKSVVPVAVPVVEKLTGYLPGGVSPFGTRHILPLYIEASILALETIFINGGKRGFLLAMSPNDLVALRHPQPVEVAV